MNYKTPKTYNTQYRKSLHNKPNTSTNTAKKIKIKWNTNCKKVENKGENQKPTQNFPIETKNKLKNIEPTETEMDLYLQSKIYK